MIERFHVITSLNYAIPSRLFSVSAKVQWTATFRCPLDIFSHKMLLRVTAFETCSSFFSAKTCLREMSNTNSFSLEKVGIIGGPRQAVSRGASLGGMA